MKNKIYFLAGIITAISAFLLSCDENMLNEMLTRKEPFNDTVEIQEMRDINAVHLKWRKDAGADSYVLSKSIYHEN